MTEGFVGSKKTGHSIKGVVVEAPGVLRFFLPKMSISPTLV